MTAPTRAATNKLHMCGFCMGAPVCAEGTRFAHGHCWSPDASPCACAEAEHKLTPAIAERMSVYCHCSMEYVYARHDRKRRVVTAEQKAELAERLKHAREVKAAKQQEVL